MAASTTCSRRRGRCLKLCRSCTWPPWPARRSPKNCTACHNRKNQREPDVSGGLALDSYEAVRNGAKEPVVHPGKSSASLLIQRVTANDDDKRMPLGATPLAPETIVLLRRWIDTG